VAKKRRKPGPGGKAGGSVAGPQPNESPARVGAPGARCRWKALWAGKVVALDGAAAEAVLVPRKSLEHASRRSAGRDRERQRRPLPTMSRSKTPRQSGALPGSGARLCSEMRGSCGRAELKLGTRRQAHANLGSSRRKVARRRCCESAEVTRRAWIAEARGFGRRMVKTSRPGVERSTGARVVCRLQKSATSVLFLLH
jgi:hypothetical protein